MKREDFERTLVLNKCNRYVRTMKVTHATAFRKINAHWLDGKDIEATFDGEFTTIILPSSELFEKAYGPVKLIFKGNSTRQGDLCKVCPEDYFQGCFLDMPITVHGIMCPNRPQDKFKVELAYRTLSRGQ